jgi:hypothetical protein
MMDLPTSRLTLSTLFGSDNVTLDTPTHRGGRKTPDGELFLETQMALIQARRQLGVLGP